MLLGGNAYGLKTIRKWYKEQKMFSVDCFSYKKLFSNPNFVPHNVGVWEHTLILTSDIFKSKIAVRNVCAFLNYLNDQRVRAEKPHEYIYLIDIEDPKVFLRILGSCSSFKNIYISNTLPCFNRPVIFPEGFNLKLENIFFCVYTDGEEIFQFFSQLTKLQ